MADVNENFLLLASGYLFPEIARRTKRWQEKNPNEEILRLGIGNTTEALTPYIVSAMREKLDLLSERKSYTGYGDEQGDSALRNALSDYYKKEYGVEISSDEFFVSDGAKSDAANIQSIFSSSSTIAVQDPAYPVYVDSNVASGHTGPWDEAKGLYSGIVYMKGDEENDFVPSPPQTHVDLIYLCFPNNPTGAVATKEELEKFISYALKEKAVIIFDAAYAEYIRTPGIAHTIYELEGAENCAIEINSFSKSAGFTGVRLGWAIVPKTIDSGNAPMGTIHRMWNRRQTTFFNGASNIAQAGGLAALSEKGKEECQSLVNYYLDNAKIIKDGLESVGLKTFGGVDSPYVWARCPANMTSWEFFDYLLDKAHVVVTPGSGFGSAGEGYVRVSSYGHKEDIIKAVLSVKENI